MKRKRLASVLIALMFAVAILVIVIERRNARPVIGATSSAPNAIEEPAHVLPRQPTRPETATSPEGLTGVEYERYFIQRRKIDPAFEWKHPINFWGRVLDEANGPVQGAAIRFEWNDTSSKGTSRETVLSDEDGNFTLLNKKGKGLTVSA